MTSRRKQLAPCKVREQPSSTSNVNNCEPTVKLEREEIWKYSVSPKKIGEDNLKIGKTDSTQQRFSARIRARANDDVNSKNEVETKSTAS
uniref:Uncharacterized protein n=1 Tax=Ciona intestinalis TaxID=7719 RepID=F7AEV9_CIOIN